MNTQKTDNTPEPKLSRMKTQQEVLPSLISCYILDSHTNTNSPVMAQNGYTDQQNIPEDQERSPCFFTKRKKDNTFNK